MRRVALALLVLVLLVPAACGRDENEVENHLPRLAELMTGTFSSAVHAAEDETYRDVTLRMVPIWTMRADGPWLYVEQAMSGDLDRPYRQRIYHLRHVGDDLYESRVLKPDPLEAYVGAWAEPSRFDSIGPEDLEDMPGCAVILRRIDADTFRGSTLAGDCENSWGDAAYATSHVEVKAAGITSWDRGYDAEGEQVWGATRGGYRFLRVE